MLRDVPEDPANKDFNWGKTLGEKYRHWKRVRKRMPPRYRTFFRYHSDFVIRKGSSAEKCIIFVWFNDELTLRKEDAKTDCYNVLLRLIKRGTIPDDWNALFNLSDSVDQKQN